MSSNIIESEIIEPAPIDQIRSVKGEREISSSFPSYLVDESKISGGHANWLFFPKTESDFVTIFDKMRRDNHQITISAARTGIVGSAIPFGGAVVSLERMNKLFGLGFDEEVGKWFLRIQPSLSLNQINEIVKLKKLEDHHSIPPEKNWVEKFKENCTHYYPKGLFNRDNVFAFIG